MRALIIFAMLASLCQCFSIFEGTNDLENPVSSSFSDWDSSLYGKPICVPIPSNMSLCNNINYKQMKMPNLLGHETLDEVSSDLFFLVFEFFYFFKGESFKNGTKIEILIILEAFIDIISILINIQIRNIQEEEFQC